MVWSVLGKVIQSNDRFVLTDRLEIHLDHFEMPAGNGNQDDSTHSDQERCIVGTWIVDEVLKAVDMGYGLVDVYEFW